MSHIAVDWAHEEKKVRAWDGNTMSNDWPKPSPDLVLAVENCPPKLLKPYVDAGSKIFRCCTDQTAKYRKIANIEKTDDNDAQVIWLLYKYKPEEFYEYKFNPVFYDFQCLYRMFKESQKSRMAQKNRAWHGESEVLNKWASEAVAKEKGVLKDIEKYLKKFPIYTKWLKDQPGIGPAVAAGLLAFVGDIRRFNTVSQLFKYFGLDVRADNTAPRKKRGETAKWHHEGRALLLGIIADQFVKAKGGVTINEKTGRVTRRKQSSWRDLYEKNKASELLKPNIPLFQADKRARRKTVKVFVKQFFKKYKEFTRE